MVYHINKDEKDDLVLILINKYEKAAVTEKYPTVHIARTMKQDSKRGHYYMEERKDAVAYLNELRGTTNTKDRKKA